MEGDQPLTPAGRLFVQPLTNQIIHCAIAVELPIDVDAVKAELRSSVMLKHPRFCSLMVRDAACGREHWRRTAVDLERHLLVRRQPLSEDPSVSDEDAVNDFIADLSVSSPLPTDKPLWEIHLLLAHNTAVFRVHHALGDGISLMSMLLSCCRKADDRSQTPTIGGVGASSSSSSSAALRRSRWSFWTFVKVVWYTLVHFLEFSMRALWLKDKPTALSGGAAVELWPRKLASARFRLEDMKLVKRSVAGARVGCRDTWTGQIQKVNAWVGQLPEGLQLTGLAMINLRPEAGLQDVAELMNRTSGSRWGNKFGMLLLPVYYYHDNSDPMGFVRRGKAMIDKKKLSFEAPLSYYIGFLIMSIFGPKVASILNYRIVCNTTFTVSNVVGPQEAITVVDNPVKYLRVSSSSLPHVCNHHAYGKLCRNGGDANPSGQGCNTRPQASCPLLPRSLARYETTGTGTGTGTSVASKSLARCFCA
ncbi:wax ester synthase/diacylglycerol acyltransferase 5-like isoform X2 [Andrographis paniculata]|uniref:wax ester synthase/diacylglycerol acyltransferase 5-like isoform X2 n=1 Tax=Andrographis paniculata TaxID=175694 RepID=UPI0021E8DACE|nr:wax ester synthase/diacylglycerol acyltransferase 5-like isoform X2 [Andrographis paniculata]